MTPTGIMQSDDIADLAGGRSTTEEVMLDGVDSRRRFAAEALLSSRQDRETLVRSLERVPRVLRDVPQWIFWRIGFDDKGKATKLPYRASPGEYRATSTDPSTWNTFQRACEIFLTDHGGNFSGLGFCFEGSGLTGVDLDDVLGTEGGDAVPWADEVIAELDSYTELSPSGQGVHIFVRGDFDGAGKRRKFTSDGTAFEMYCRGRFFCMTGKQRIGSPDTIREFDCRSLADRLDHGRIGPTSDCLRKMLEQQRVLFTPPPRNGRPFDLAAFLQRHSIEVLSGPTQKGGIVLYEIVCPIAGGNHKNPRDGRAFVAQKSNGALVAGCLHESCSFSNSKGNQWERLRNRYEPCQPGQKELKGPGAAHRVHATDPMPADSGPPKQTATPIRQFADIPDILTMDIQPPEYFVDGLIAR